MKRPGGLRARSSKRRRAYVDRREFVARFLTEHPVCQLCDRHRSVDVHEVKSRARGGSILDESNCLALCRLCHEVVVTAQPAAAEAAGLSLPSWATPSNTPNGELQ